MRYCPKISICVMPKPVGCFRPGTNHLIGLVCHVNILAGTIQFEWGYPFLVVSISIYFTEYVAVRVRVVQIVHFVCLVNKFFPKLGKKTQSPKTVLKLFLNKNSYPDTQAQALPCFLITLSLPTWTQLQGSRG